MTRAIGAGKAPRFRWPEHLRMRGSVGFVTAYGTRKRERAAYREGWNAYRKALGAAKGGREG